jgi:hypothetical protein
MRQQPTSRAYELIYPADWPTFGGLPAYVAVGTGDKPWERLWELRDISGSRLSMWFRSLAASGLQPQESNRWLPRTPMTHRTATKVARLRLRQIERWAGGWPVWLLNDRPGRPAKPPKALRPVARVFNDGRVDRFPSTWAAARAMRTTPEGVRWWLRSGRADRDGARWVELQPKRG